MEVRLNDYVDGNLDAGDRAALEAHLAGCTGCRAAVAELRDLITAGQGLPRTVVPERDLWPRIAARINERRRARAWWRERTFWAGAVAAAATVVLTFALYRLLAPATAVYRPRGEGWVAVQAEYDHAAEELSGLLAARRGRLQPTTVALVERNLGIIDQALRESRAALARDPGNPELRGLYAAAARQKVELLQWAARVAEEG